MTDKKKHGLSDRHVVINRMARVIRENLIGKGLVEQVEENNRKFYQTEFNKGKVNVYGTDFIQIVYETGGKKGEPVFETPDQASRFFKLAILQGKWDEAEKIPTKKPAEEVDKAD